MSHHCPEQVLVRADGFYHPFIPTPGPLRYRAISPDKESSYVGAAAAASCCHYTLQQHSPSVVVS